MLLDLTTALILASTSSAPVDLSNRTNEHRPFIKSPRRLVKNTQPADRKSKNAYARQPTDIQLCHNSSIAAKVVTACTKLLQSPLPEQGNLQARLLIHRGNAFLAQQKIAKAFLDFDRALKINPKYPQAYFYRGAANSKLKRYLLAIKDYSQAIALKPDFVEAYFNRGTAYGRLRHFPRATADLSTVIGFKPELAKAYTNRGTAYTWMGRSKQALLDFKQAILLDPKQTIARINRAKIYRKQGQPLKAFDDYRAGFRISRPARIKTLQKRLQKNDDYRGKLDGVFDQTTEFSLKGCLRTHAYNRHKL